MQTTSRTSGSVPQILSHAGPLLERYAVVFCDVWGVVHNGVTAFEDACRALEKFRAGGGEWPEQSPKVPAPMLSTFRKVIANKNLLFLGIACSGYLTLQACINSYLVLELVESKSMSVIVAGTFLMVASVGGAAGRIMWGAVSDRVFNGRRKQVMSIIGLLSGTLAIILSISLNNTHGWMMYVIMALLGACAFGWNGVLNVFATEISGKETAATGLGWTMSVATLGGVLGPPLFGYIVDKTSSYSPAWLVLGILVIGAAFLITFIKEQKATS